jgi:CRP/FNR family transcriptional regulator, cyclic AMP receptor protein
MNSEDLKQIAVLQSIEGDVLSRLAAALEKKEYSDGQTIFSEGDSPDAMYFIQHGSVRIEKRASKAAQKTLAVLQAGDYFGEMALFEQKPRSASAAASGPATLLRLSKPAFDELHQKNSAAGFNLLFAMIRTSSERIRRLSTDVVVYDEIGKAIGESQDLQTLCDVILQQLTAATLADWGLLLICSQFSDCFEIRAQVNLNLAREQLEAICNANGFLEPVRQNPRDLLVDNIDQEESFKSCPRLGFETTSLLVAVITVGGQFLGLILLGGQERGLFGPNHLNLARGVARQAGQAILNARHREEEHARSRHSRQFVRF